MELRDLITFRVIAETKKFRLASEILNYTQPTLTARIKNLEEELGISLLDRNSQGVTLTEAGNLFLPFVQKITTTSEEAINALNLWKNNFQASLTIGSSFYVCCYELPSVLLVFNQLYPGICIHIRAARSLDIIEMLENNDIQLGIARRVRTYSNLERFKLSEEPIMLCTHPAHPLSHSTNISLLDISNIPLISYQKGKGFWADVETKFRNLNLTFNKIMELDSMEAIKKMIVQTEGASLLPLASVKSEVAEGKICVSSINPRLTRDTYLYHHAVDDLSTPARAFIETIKCCIKNKTLVTP